MKYSNIQKTIETSVNIILILLILNLLSINLGIISQPLTIFFTTFLLIGFLLLNLPLKKLLVNLLKIDLHIIHLQLAGFLFIIFSFILLLFSNNKILWMISIPIAISGLSITLQSVQIQKKELSLLGLASFVYAVLFILFQTIPFLWFIVQSFSLNFSKIFGLSTGASVSGLWITIIFIVFSVVVFFLSINRKNLSKSFVKFFAAIIGLFICWIIYLIILRFVRFEVKDDLVSLLYIVFIIGLIPILLYFFKQNLAGSVITCPNFRNFRLKYIFKNGVTLVVVFLFLSVLLLMIYPPYDEGDDVSTVLFYGQDMLGTWDIPGYGKYGRDGVGMFGLLPVYLSSSGFDTRILVEDSVDFLNSSQMALGNITSYVNLTDYVSLVESSELSADVLDGVDVFVVVNLNNSFSDVEKQVIVDFVGNGGGLLVLGDHTNVGGIRGPLNDLLFSFDVGFNFDSALPLDSDFQWQFCYQFLDSPVTDGLSVDEVQISVGASLDVGSVWNPVVVGRYGFGDVGNSSNEDLAFLGDYSYNHGEQLGDVVLAASCGFGEGRVLVFGDTSSFQNSALPYSFSFVSGCFSWLSNGSSWGFVLPILSIIFLFISLIVYIFIYIKQGGLRQKPFYSMLIVLAVFTAAIVNPMLIQEPDLEENLVLIDASHNERFNLQSYTDESLNGLMINLMRNNYHPVIQKNFEEEQITNSKIIVFNAPSKRFSKSEVQFLKQYMNDGGIVILATGYEDKSASYPLLKEFDLDIENTPLGPVPYIENNTQEYQEKPRFVDSWPILFYKNQRNILSYYNFTIEGWEQEFHLIIFVKHGEGGLLLISDSQYLLDKNLESIYDYWPGNILLLKYLIDEFKSMEVGG